MNITVYGTSTCLHCTAAKDFLALIGIPFKEVDVGADPVAAQEMVNRTGQRSVPVIDVNGTIVVGFNRNALLDSLRASGFLV